MEKTLENPSGYDWAAHAQCRTEDLKVHDREIDEARGACAWVLSQVRTASIAGDADLTELHRLQLARRGAFLVGLEAERLMILENRDFCASVAARLAAPYSVPVDPQDEFECDSCQ